MKLLWKKEQDIGLFGGDNVFLIISSSFSKKILKKYFKSYVTMTKAKISSVYNEMRIDDGLGLSSHLICKYYMRIIFLKIT